MQLEFIPVEDFYFALTLAVKTLEDIDDPAAREQVRSHLAEKFGQPSTIAPSRQTFSYVFRISGYDAIDPLIVSISDWQDKLRLSTDYGWTLDEERKPVRSEQFEKRNQFAKELRSHLQDWLGIQF
jgi:hypothetical protein